MGRRKGRQGETTETLRSRATEKVDDDGDESLSSNIAGQEGDEEASGRFFACYLLTSLSPRFKGHTYIGFTVNPRRRIRQHNGEITCGAWRTKKKRPWEMVLCIYGFPTNVAALQFEWAWQHPVESLAVRQAAATFKSLSGLANKIKLAYTMLNLPSWQRLNLTVNYFSTKYMKHAAGCPVLPEQMRVKVCAIEDLPRCTRSSSCSDEHDELQYADDESEQSGGFLESTKNELADTQKHNDDVVFVEDDVECGPQGWAEQGGGCTKRTILERMKNSQLCDQNSVQETPFSFSSSNKMTANADDTGTFSLSDELLGQPRISGAKEKDFHKQSLQTSGCHVGAPSLSVSSCNNMMTIAEDREIFGSPDKFLGQKENEVNKHSFQPNGCLVGATSLFLSSCNKVATIAEDKERIFGLLDSIDEHTLLQKQQNPRTSVPSKDRPLIMSSEVEVIDVFTPPPCYKANTRSKKRRRSKGEIIDLTMSPLLV